jgi:hypothetical protein
MDNSNDYPPKLSSQYQLDYGYVVRCVSSLPTISVSPSTATFAAGGETKTFTVTTTNFSGTPTVTKSSAAAWITSASVSGSTLTVTAGDNPTTFARTATITLTAGTATATVTVTQGGTLRGGENHVLYFDDGTIKVGRWDTSLTAEDEASGVVRLTDADRSKLAFFKFGSVIGFDMDGTLSGSMTAIKFNPSNLTIGEDITGPGNYSTTLPGIPGFTNDDYNNGIRNVSDRVNYHTEANLLNGKGDPCMLAGIDMTKLSEPDYLATYDSGWRLPTLEENRMFIGNASTDDSAHDAGTTYYQITPSSWSSSTPGTGIFPANTAREEAPRLPATGIRMPSLLNVGIGGSYWSNAPISSGASYSLSFRADAVKTNGTAGWFFGYAVRCMSTGETPTPLPTISVSPTSASFAAAGDTKTFTVNTTNFSSAPTVSLSDGASSWLTYTLNGSTLSLTAAANTATTSRTATVTLTAVTATATVTVTQAAGVIPALDGVTIAPPGVIGYIKGTNTLTLKGSKEYKNAKSVDSNNDGIGDIEQYAIDNFGGLSDSTVYVASFPCNSLVALTTTNSIRPLGPSNIVAAPEEWKGSLQDARDYIGSDYSKIPYNDSKGTVNEFKNDLANGLGDPCAYYTNYFGLGWELPTALPYNGYVASDLTWEEVDALGTGIPAGMLSAKDGETGVFYPAAGIVAYTPDYVYISGLGSSGDYMANSTSNFLLYFNRNGALSLGSNTSHNSGFPVRCVRN